MQVRSPEIPIMQPETQESLRHFDVMASVDLMRFDLINTGSVLPETYQRVFDEEFSFVAEGLDLPITTKFGLKEIDGEFSYFSRGEWQPYMALLTNGIKSAQYEASLDPRKSFLVEMACNDYLVGKQWTDLKPGEKRHWYSEFRDEELALYGAKFLDDLGLQSERRMGFIYEAERDQDGNLILTSHSVDNSDGDAFVHAMLAAEQGEDAVAAYDDFMAHKYGMEFNAGRLQGEEENAWDVIRRHRDLIDYYMENLESMAGNFHVDRADLEKDKKQLTYGFWAAIKVRMDQEIRGIVGNQVSYGSQISIPQEVAVAYRQLQSRGEVLLGCGGSIGAVEDLMSANPGDVFRSIFGDKPFEDQFGSLTFRCQNGHKNKRTYGKLLDECTKCSISVSCKKK